MTTQAILLRDRSKDSQQASRLLNKHRIGHVQLYLSSQGKLPCVVSEHSAYPYEGLVGIRRFVRSVVARRSSPAFATYD
jgi:hypothetical protein